jgi:hypothetical protein
MTSYRNHRLPLFAGLALVMMGVEWWVTRSAALARGGAVPVAVAVDLVIVLPGAFFLLVLRPAQRPLLGAAPVLALGALLAATLLGARPETKVLLRVAGGFAELAVLALLVRRVRVAAGQLRGADQEDLLLRIGALTDPMLRLLGAELATVYYAFVGPFVRRPARADEFRYTEESGAGATLFALGLMLTMEGLAVHVVLHAFHPRAAWVLAAANAYALVWLAAAAQAARLRPVALTDDRLLVRTSLLWTVDVPRVTIVALEPISGAPSGEEARGVLRAAFGVAPNLLLTLAEPVLAKGPVGIARSVRRIALYVDEPARLRSALATTAAARPVRGPVA